MEAELHQAGDRGKPGASWQSREEIFDPQRLNTICSTEEK